MKIRILSDLHVDVNEMYACHRRIRLDQPDTFTIVAGDTAGTPETAIKWIRNNIRQGLIISGNHIVYGGNQCPIQELKQQMANAFPKESPVTYLDHMTGTMSKEINNLLFIGTTLYTNYSLFPDIPTENAMWFSQRHLNDFAVGYTRDGNNVRPFYPKDYRRWFIESQKEITRMVEAHPDQDIVVITHHCPSKKCCLYPDELINASYASDLEPFIREHPNIRLWIAGHAHNRKHFKIGNCLVLMNPRGYEHEGETFGFNPNTYVETTDWSIHQDPSKTLSDKESDRYHFQQLLKRACFEL